MLGGNRVDIVTLARKESKKTQKYDDVEDHGRCKSAFHLIANQTCNRNHTNGANVKIPVQLSETEYDAGKPDMEERPSQLRA